MIIGDRPLVALAIGFLAGKQFIMVDEVGGQHLVHDVQVPLACASKNGGPMPCSSLRRHSSFLLLANLTFFLWVDTIHDATRRSSAH